MIKGQAIELCNSGWWKEKTAREIVEFQLYENKLCMPFDEFHKAITEALGRSVWTHEFADQKGLQAEYEGKREHEYNPIQSAKRILHDLGRDDLADDMMVVVADTK